MADKKISELTAATTPLAGTEVLPIVQSNSTKKVAVSDLTAGRAISASEVTVSTLTSGRVPYVGTSGKLSDTPNFQWDVANSRLGIGISPSYTLHVARSSAGFIGAFRATDVTASAQFIIAGNSQGDLIAASTTTGNGLIYADSGKTLSLGANGSTSARLTVTTAGDVSIPSNNLVMGTAGKGIDFSANTNAAGMTSELLSWYEQGTANTASGSLTTNFSFSSNQIRYTRIGDTVHVWFDYQWTSSNAGAGDTVLDTLPFTASGDGVVTFSTMNGNIAADQVYGIVLNGTNTFKIYGRNNGTATLYGPAPRTIWDAGGVNVNKLIGYAVYKAA